MKIVKRLIIIVLVIILVASGFFGYRYYEYIKIVNRLGSCDEYKSESKKEYVDFLSLYPDLDDNVVIALVNNGINTTDERAINLARTEEFDITRIQRYLKFMNKYELEAEKIITYVNNSFDLVEDDDLEIIVNFFKEKYFIKANLKNYLDYYREYCYLSYKEIIKRVNSGICYSFYTNDMPTDLSKSILIICNKFYKIESDYVPDNLVVISPDYSSSGARLVKEAAEAFEYMCSDAKNSNQIIKAYEDNGYRSYNYQQQIYDYYYNLYGRGDADYISARPGYSEHQTGLAIDVEVNGSKYNTNHQLDWLMENSYKYGFIYRYQGNEEYITGYQQEPWHYRYVGVEAAKVIHDEQLTFEEFYAFYVNDNTISDADFIALFNIELY